MAKYSIQLLTATTAEWNNSNYVIPEGELVAEIKEDGLVQLKIGNGLNKFSDLPYTAEKGPQGEQGTGLTIKGTHTNQTTLQSNVKNPSVGDAYGVGTSAPYDIYIYTNDNVWRNFGKITGTDGKTPVKGEDYWTDEDKAEIQQYVEDAILNGKW